MEGDREPICARDPRGGHASCCPSSSSASVSLQEQGSVPECARDVLLFDCYLGRAVMFKSGRRSTCLRESCKGELPPSPCIAAPVCSAILLLTPKSCLLSFVYAIMGLLSLAIGGLLLSAAQLATAV